MLPKCHELPLHFTPPPAVDYPFPFLHVVEPAFNIKGYIFATLLQRVATDGNVYATKIQLIDTHGRLIYTQI